MSLLAIHRYFHTMAKVLLNIVLLIIVSNGIAQQKQDSSLAHAKNISIHAQATLLSQYHFTFNAPYFGDNSLLSSEPAASSISTTFFLNWKFAKILT